MANFYVDELRPYKIGKRCHLWTDGTDEELDAFARSISVSKRNAEVSNGALLGRFYHYDLTMSARVRAISQGAERISLKHWIAKTMTAEKFLKLKETFGGKPKARPTGPGPDQPDLAERGRGDGGVSVPLGPQPVDVPEP